ncbi:DUF4402 domain-containing protein [Burkholderiaceae bacterium UC74_6]
MKISRSPSRSRSTEALALALLLASLYAGDAPAQSLSNSAGLSFGSFAAGMGGTITVNAVGARSKSGNVVLASGGVASAAQFLLTGTPGATYTITLPSDGTVVLSNGGSTMALNSFVSTPSGANIPLGGGGTQIISVGATLTVSAAQAPGNYTGSFNVTVDYP